MLMLTQMDMVMNWDARNVDIFVNGSYRDSCNFFDEDISEVDQVLLYNLNSSTSYWSNLVICKDICYAFNGEMGTLLGTFWIILIFGGYLYF